MTIGGNLTTGSFTMSAGAGANKVLTTNASGVATWQIPAGGSLWTQTGDDIYYTGNVGIGTTTPNNLLSVYQLIDFNNTDFNTKLGYQAGKNIVSGAQYNTFVGYQAGYSSSTGSTNAADYNTAVGEKSLFSNTTGNYNSAMGAYALYDNTTGSENSAMGEGALYSNTTGDNNSAMGYDALSDNTTGYQNSAMGYLALYNNTTGDYNSAMGGYALSDNTTGYENSAVGSEALNYNTTGNNNSAMGSYALSDNTTGSENSAMGMRALSYNTTGYYNTAMGVYALYNNTTGYYNTGLGYYSLRYSNSTSTVAIGAYAGYGVSGGNIQNTVIVGYRAGYALATSSNNILLGYQAGDNLTTGSNNILLGYDIDAPATSTANFLSIGNLIFATGGFGTAKTIGTGNVGIGTTTPSEKLVVAGNIKITGKIYGGTNCPSDMAYIPGDQPFCIDKYEAYKVSGTVVNSTCTNGSQSEVDANATTAIAGSATGQTPQVSINWCAAKKMCQNAGKHLCTNQEWFQACNYKGSQWNIIDEETSETMSCNTATECAAACLTGASPACVTQEGAYDMIGNVTEWVDKVITANPTTITASNFVTGYDFATALPTSVGVTAVPLYGNDYVNASGMPAVAVMLRGGSWPDGGRDGCFFVGWTNAPSGTYTSIGFRCCQ